MLFITEGSRFPPDAVKLALTYDEHGNVVIKARRISQIGSPDRNVSDTVICIERTGKVWLTPAASRYGLNALPAPVQAEPAGAPSGEGV